MAFSLLPIFIVASMLQVGVYSTPVLTMDGNVSGYGPGGKITSFSSRIISTSQQDFYKNDNECIRRIIIGVNDVEVQQVKVQCSFNLRSINGIYQYENAFILMPEPGTNNVKTLYNIGNGKCIRRIYNIQGTPKTIDKIVDETVKDQECKDLSDGKYLVPNPFDDGKGGMDFRKPGKMTFGNEKITGLNGGTFNMGSQDHEQEEELEGEDDEDEEQDGDDDDEDVEDEGVDDEDEEIKSHTNPATYTSPPPADEYLTLEKQKVAVLSGNVVGYEVSGSPETVDGKAFSFTVQKYVKPGSEECLKLVTVRWLNEDDILDFVKISCGYEEPDPERGFNLRFDGVIYESPLFEVTYVVKDGVCRTKSYFKHSESDEPLSVKQCDELTRRTLDQRKSGVIPGTEPISPVDIATMEKQIVAVMDGSVKGYKSKGTMTKYSTENYDLEVQDFEKNGQCVKVVSIKRNDHNQYFERVKLPCRITGPVVTKDEDIQLNYGNVIYIINYATMVFITKDGACLQRSYTIMWNEVNKDDTVLNQPDCFQLTRWRQQQRRTAAKLNNQPPPKTDQAPGDMWLIAIDGNTSQFKKGQGTFSMGAISTQNFYRGEQCIRLAVITIEGLEFERLKVSCGPITNVMNGGSIVYGKAFFFKRDRKANTYIGLFNLRKNFCMKRIYTINKGSKTVSKSQLNRSDEKDCKDLIAGKIRPMSGKVQISGVTGGVFNLS